MVNKTFRGDCMGVKISERGPGDPHLMFTLEVEDDENWFEKETVSSAWIDELIEQLQIAQTYLETQEPDIHNNIQYGWKTKKSKKSKKSKKKGK